jgi:hypothetical protein
MLTGVEPVAAGLVDDLLAGDDDLELLRLVVPAGDQVDVHRRAPAQRRQQQLDRGEVVIGARSEADLAAARVGGDVSPLPPAEHGDLLGG